MVLTRRGDPGTGLSLTPGCLAPTESAPVSLSIINLGRGVPLGTLNRSATSWIVRDERSRPRLGIGATERGWECSPERLEARVALADWFRVRCGRRLA